jgi:hypothetical protein
VVLANEREKCGVCDFGCPTELVHLVGVSISFENNVNRLPFTPPLSGRLIGPSTFLSSILLFQPFCFLLRLYSDLGRSKWPANLRTTLGALSLTGSLPVQRS